MYPRVHPESIRFMILSLSGLQRLKLYPSIPELAITPSLSPDGQWLAYVSRKNNNVELIHGRQVFIRKFQGAGRTYEVDAS